MAQSLEILNQVGGERRKMVAGEGNDEPHLLSIARVVRQFRTDLIAFRVALTAHEGLHQLGKPVTLHSEAREVCTSGDDGLRCGVDIECGVVKFD